MKQTNSNDLITIGKIIKAKGVKGEVKVFPLTDRPERFFELDNVYLESGNQNAVQLTVKKVSEYSGIIILKLSGINDRNAAEDLKGSYISVLKTDTYELDTDSYFNYDIKGLSVYSTIDVCIGIVKDVLEYPANDVLLIITDKEEYLLPATKEYVPEVDIKNNKIVVILPEGLPAYPKGTF